MGRKKQGNQTTILQVAAQAMLKAGLVPSEVIEVTQDINGLAWGATESIIAAIRNESPKGNLLDVILRQGHTTRQLQPV